MCSRSTAPLLLAILLAGARPVAADVLTPEQRLGTHFAGAAQVLLARDNPSMQAIRASLAFVREAVAIDPDNADNWRALRDLALLAEREDLYADAVDALVRVDPKDDVALLQRITLALERYNSVEERVKAYDRLLQPERRDELGPAVASRLALNLALLQRRHGDIDAFADALSLAVAIDPSNLAAAAMAAGFFRTHVEDAYGEAELLLNLVIADPSDVTSQLTLARMLIEQGAYAGAARMYSMATRSSDAMRAPPSDDLLADLAIARWGAGEDDEALRLIRERQQVRSEMARMRIMEVDPSMGPLERAKQHAILSPALGAVRAAITALRDDPDASDWVARALRDYGSEIDRSVGIDPAQDARLQLERAWVAVWLGDDVELVRFALAEAEAYKPLAPQARTRFEGWIALRQGNFEIAMTLFSALPQDDAVAAIGLAETLLQLGDRKAAATAFLRAARAQPGSLIGVWAMNRLAVIVGRRFPLSAEAQRLNDLIATLPSAFDRYPEDATLAVDLSIEPARTNFGPYDPLIINVEIANKSQYPLAIDRDGPIRPQVLMFVTTTLSRIGGSDTLNPIVVKIDRRLRLEPRERLVIPVDLRRYDLGDILSTRAARGTFLRAKAILNFYGTQTGAVVPGLLGDEEWTPVVRIDGTRLSALWLQEAARSLAATKDSSVLADLAILGQIASYPLPQDANPEMFRLAEMARVAVVDAYPNMDHVTQAWFLSTLPAGGLFDPLESMARSSEDRLVRIAYLMSHLSGPDDPMLDAARRSDDEPLRVLAEGSTELYARLAAAIAAKRRQAGAEAAPPEERDE